MAGIEDKAEPLGVGQLQQRGNLLRRFDIPGAVMMEDGTKAGLVKYSSCNQVCAARECFPLRRRETICRSDATCNASPHGIGAVIVSQHQKRRGRTGNSGQQARSLHRRSHAFSVSGRILHRHGNECAQHHQVALLDLLVQRSGVRGHVAPVAHFSPGIAGLNEFVQHAVEGICCPCVLVLQRAPRARGIPNAQCPSCFLLQNFRLQSLGQRSTTTLVCV